jgi:hypothetical protein
LKDGVVVRTTPRLVGSALYLDSSFNYVSLIDGVKNLVFGPMGESGTGFNAIITPADYRILTATGSSTTSALANNNLTYNGNKLEIGSVTGATGVAFNVLGQSGQLFSVTDTLIGDVFQVTDISGTPILTVNTDEIVTIAGDLYMNSANVSGLTTTSTVMTVPYSAISSSALFFDYYVNNSSTGAYRAGTVMAVTNGSTVAYTDTSTTDLVASTSGIEFSVDILSTNIRLVSTITTGTWKVKVGARVI